MIHSKCPQKQYKESRKSGEKTNVTLINQKLKFFFSNYYTLNHEKKIARTF